MSMSLTVLHPPPAGRTGMIEVLTALIASAGLPSTSGACATAELPPFHGEVRVVWTLAARRADVRPG
ncbi:hypothetical protein [Sorangium sp. So ce131]|uniref:hypothetical protein n=1 Tax=Sorangium sp. So ce131 TaxID=3133282 RepID=UPI003F6462FC